jgi:hypothetical protein
MRVGVGRSERREPVEAASEAVEIAVSGLQGEVPRALLVFSTTGYDQDVLLRAVAARAGTARVVGCSAEGLIFKQAAIESDFALGVMAFSTGHGTTLDTFLVDGYGDDSALAGSTLGERVSAALGEEGAGLCLMVFPDGLSGDCTEFLDALARKLPRGLPVVGASAGDAMRLTATYQYGEGRVVSRGVSAMLVRGKGSVLTATSHGCNPIGRALTVTQAEHGWVSALDGKPAWSIFREYLDGEPTDLLADAIAHLCIGRKNAAGELDIIRSPMQLRKEDGALLFPGGLLRHGDTVFMVRRDAEKMVANAKSSARSLRERAGGKEPTLVLQFDCCGRGKLMLGSRVAERLVTPLQEQLGAEVPWLGFHGYGEITEASGHPAFHNYTVVLVAYFAEDAA